ncbi:hypothetical protein R6Q59_032159 [Mikania micrantha]|uniref:FLZ-type domain-containing protein n=1 Tax=Mikania micrantha TaxID=192012 RepID=A0A5N6NQD1_9ASTR|nr:hypothetical protein E3N88_16877 [Mikania micrantha]
MRTVSLSYAGHEEPHFLEACNLCSKSLGHNTDIFMYRGNTPFCSQECRQEQIGIDEAIERKCRRVSKKSTSEISKKSSTIQTETLVA